MEKQGSNFGLTFHLKLPDMVTSVCPKPVEEERKRKKYFVKILFNSFLANVRSNTYQNNLYRKY